MPLTTEQKQAIEVLSGIDRADAVEFAAELRNHADDLHQHLFKGGFTEAEKRWKTRAQAAEQKARELEDKVPTGDSLVLKGQEKDVYEKVRAANIDLGSLPDALILTGDKRTRAEALEALGRAPEEIATALQEGEAARGELNRAQKLASVRQMAADAGFKNPDAYVALQGAVEMEYTKRTEKVGGKDMERVYVKAATDAEPRLLDLAFVTSRGDWKPLAPALSAGEEKPTTYRPDPLDGGGGRGGTPAAANAHREAVTSQADYQL